MVRCMRKESQMQGGILYKRGEILNCLHVAYASLEDEMRVKGSGKLSFGTPRPILESSLGCMPTE